MNINDQEFVEICFPSLSAEASQTISRWKSYTIQHRFLAPSATFTMVIGGKEVSAEVLAALKPGLKVEFRIGGNVQFSGYLDTYTTSADRQNGTEVTISGRDLMAPVIDACADYTIKVNAKDKLSTVVAKFLEPFDFGGVEFDNRANVEVIQGHFSGRKLPEPHTGGHRQRHRTRHRKKTSGWETSLLVPFPGEGTYEFLNRLLVREGLYLWARADTQNGKGTAVVSVPDVFSTPDYSVNFLREGRSNVLEASCTRDWKDQPSIVFVSGANRHEGYSRGKHKCFIQNPFSSIDPDDQTTAYYTEINRLKKKHGNARELVVALQTAQWKYLLLNPVARPTFLVAPEGETPSQVEFFARRYLADKMRKHFTYTCTVDGHTSPEGLVWAVDSIVRVKDEYNNVDENLYIIGKTFQKSRGGGTTTKLEMVRPESLEWI